MSSDIHQTPADLADTLRDLARRCGDLADACADESVRDALSKTASKLGRQAEALETVQAPPLSPN